MTVFKCDAAKNCKALVIWFPDGWRCAKAPFHLQRRQDWLDEQHSSLRRHNDPTQPHNEPATPT